MKRQNDSLQQAEKAVHDGNLTLWLPRTNDPRLQLADAALQQKWKVHVSYLGLHSGAPRDVGAYNEVIAAAIQEKFHCTPEALRQEALRYADSQIRASAEEAKADIAAGKLGLRTAGLRVPKRRVSADSVLKADYGIESKPFAGCLVDALLIGQMKAYNDLMKQAILRKFGKSYEELYKTAAAKAAKQL